VGLAAEGGKNKQFSGHPFQVLPKSDETSLNPAFTSLHIYSLRPIIDGIIIMTIHPRGENMDILPFIEKPREKGAA
jgi:hypothetical protein